jgi:aminopeptidase N
LADGSEISEAESKLWTIPLIYCTEKGLSSEVIMMDSYTYELDVPMLSESGWIKLNAGQHTLMRVAYTDSLISAIIPAIQSKSISPEDRVGLISDAYALTKARKMKIEQLIILLTAFKNEDNSTVWEALEVVLVGLDQIIMDNDSIRTPYVALVSKLISPCASLIGWNPRPDDGHLSNLLRGTMVRLLGRFAWKSGAVQEESRRRFDGHCKNPDAGVLPSEYASSVYAIALKSGGESEFNQLMDLLDRLDNTAEKKQIYSAIGSVSSLELKKKVLNWAVSEVKLQDFFYPVMSVSSSGREGQELSWKYFQENFEKLKAMLSKASPSLTDAIVASCCSWFSNHEKANEIEKFFEDHPLPNNKRKVSQMIEKIRINAAFMESISNSPLASKEFWESIEL